MGVLGCCAQSQKLDLRTLDQSLAALSRKVSPSVVQVLSDAYTPVEETPGAPTAFEQATGSGMILTADGYVVTNAHVVKGSAKIQVILPNAEPAPARSSVLRPRGRRMMAKLIGLDRESDLAVLKIEAKGLPFLEFGDSENVRQGQLVFAFGSPFGLQNSMSMGIISAVARQLEADDPMIYIQSDVAVNPGNSGGPMVDVEGRVIGISTMILSESGGSEGVGLAVPANIVKAVTDQIVRNGIVRRGEIGISAQTITEAMAEALSLSRAYGVILGDISPGSAAEKAGLRIGDIVTALDGKPMENARQLQVNLYTKTVESVVEVQVLRGGETLIRKVKVTERPNDPDRFAAMTNQAVSSIPSLGIMALEITGDVKDLLPETRKTGGILVSNVLASAGRTAGSLETGDIIYLINKTPVSKLEEARKALTKFNAGDTVVMQVERDGKLRYVEITLD